MEIEMEGKWKFFGNFNVAFVRGVRAIHSKMQYTPYKMHKPHRTAHKNLICIISFVVFVCSRFAISSPLFHLGLTLPLFILSSPTSGFYFHSSTILLLCCFISFHHFVSSTASRTICIVQSITFLLLQNVRGFCWVFVFKFILTKQTPTRSDGFLLIWLRRNEKRYQTYCK